ncbi:hypothetical protein LCGC14_3116470 [marine sediment metagenome]|uniref:Uncharacterized protein n=1 Tax=marine sediment metagenome TaxID=412755 RepID=A0A0F8W3I9_9ZZZZ
MSTRYLTKAAPEQSLEEAMTEPTPTGLRHLHYAHRDGEGRWTVRTRRNALCGTARCRIVIIWQLNMSSKLLSPETEKRLSAE